MVHHVYIFAAEPLRWLDTAGSAEPTDARSRASTAVVMAVAVVFACGVANAAVTDLVLITVAVGATALEITITFTRTRCIRQPEAGQRHSGEADAEFLQRLAACD